MRLRDTKSMQFRDGYYSYKYFSFNVDATWVSVRLLLEIGISGTANLAWISLDLQRAFRTEMEQLIGNTCSTLLPPHLPAGGQCAYLNMAIKIAFSLSLPALNYSSNPLITKAFGLQLCLTRLLNLLACHVRYIVHRSLTCCVITN